MLTQAEIGLTLPEGQILNQSMGSILHGALMEIVKPDWANAMHAQKVRPYSQYVTLVDGKPCWRIQTLTEEAAEEILAPLRKKTTLFLRQRGSEVGLSGFRILKQETFSDIEEIYWGNPARIHHVDMEFCTSTSIKSAGNYAVFPDPKLVFVSLVKKWNTYSEGSVIEEENLFEHMASQMDIAGYKLHMHPFSLEGRRIRAFRGSIRYGFFKNRSAASLLATLSHFAAYAGVGIKTALGMGGTESRVIFWDKERGKQ